jgi:hypothetical protein
MVEHKKDRHAVAIRPSGHRTQVEREFEPQQETPENIRQLVAQLDAEGTGEKQE